ncbi:hypothetical protein THAOC_31357, partial [Thalassiosira oceanica]
MIRHVAFLAVLQVPSIDAFIYHLVATRPDSARPIHFDDFGDLVTSSDDDGRLPLPLSAGDVKNGSSSPDETHYRSFERLESVLLDLYGPAISSETSLRLAADGFAGDLEVVHFAKGLVSREERISTALIEDFGWKAMDAHRARVGIVGLLSAVGEGGLDPGADPRIDAGGKDRFQSTRRYQLLPPSSASNERDEDDGHELSITTPAAETEDSMDSEAPPENKTRASWKSVLRPPPHTEDNADRRTYRTLYEELDALWTYMTVQQASSVS